ncbi:hypothetical protein F511_00184 [Dorcoceras hygrometricum]|nr:hypothetical protein F511_00184 [Dorcoceras hygrometricum]
MSTSAHFNYPQRHLGAIQTATRHEKQWFLTFIDDPTRATWVYLLQHKSDTTIIFQDFHKMIKTQFHTNIRTLKTDNGKDFFHTIVGD